MHDVWWTVMDVPAIFASRFWPLLRQCVAGFHNHAQAATAKTIAANANANKSILRRVFSYQ
jgi:hypothetical protein